MSEDQSWKRGILLKTQATHEKEINYRDVNTMSIHLNSIQFLKNNKLCPDITHNHIEKENQNENRENYT